jgi:hypothetical protein
LLAVDFYLQISQHSRNQVFLLTDKRGFKGLYIKKILSVFIREIRELFWFAEKLDCVLPW